MIRCHGVYVDTSTLNNERVNAGRGVFAAERYKAGTVIETCIAMLLPYQSSALENYKLAWDDSNDAVATGCAMLYNHSENPNVVFENDMSERLIRIRTLKDVSAHEELFKKYACAVWW